MTITLKVMMLTLIMKMNSINLMNPQVLEMTIRILIVHQLNLFLQLKKTHQNPSTKEEEK